MERTDPTTRILNEQNEIELIGAELHVLEGADQGASQTLSTTAIRIGTAKDCDLVLHDPSVSSHHVELTPSDSGKFLLCDMDSKNGLYLGPWRIDRAPIFDGMRFRVGETEIEVRAEREARRIPLAPAGQYGPLLAHSVQMRALVVEMQKLAASTITVLIEGESGVGKDVVANAIHHYSNRSNGPFIVFDCSAVSMSLLPSELFGHEAGAFTGADRERKGLLEQANGGTIFLDEIGELPPDAQASLLRAIDGKKSRRVGGATEIQHDVRIVVATNRNLAEEVEQGAFRSDLYFRLAAGRLRVPPLRERKEDIVHLAQHFARRVGIEISPVLLSLLTSHRWPGNVRELRNVIDRASVLPPDQVIDVVEADESAIIDGAEIRPLADARRIASAQFERQYLEEALRRTAGNISAAAKLTGVSRQFLTRLAGRHRLRGSDRD